MMSANRFVNLKLSLARFRLACVDKGLSGLHSIRCFVVRTNEEVVTDHLSVSDGQVMVLDKRE